MNIWPFKKKDRFYPYNKIFGIGFPKTGSQSLSTALNNFNLRSLHDVPSHFNPEDLFFSGVFNPIHNDWDAFINFAQSYYQELDEQFPKSKFILTTRSAKSWLASYQSWLFGQTCELQDKTHTVNDICCRSKNPQHIINTLNTLVTTGCLTSLNSNYLLKKYKQHNAQVIRYFRNKPGQLLILKLNSRNKYKQLCDFLHVDYNLVKDKRYPHNHKQLTEYID